MYYKQVKNKKGEVRFEVLERYKDSLTGKWKTASVSYYKNTSRARLQAERDLREKIDSLTLGSLGENDKKKIRTFGELKEDWFNHWSSTVKPQTIRREKDRLKNLSKIIGDDYLLSKMTPLFVRDVLTEYIKEHDPSSGSMAHIKGALKKIFNHGVLYGVIEYSPLLAVKVDVSPNKKKEARIRREKKFLEVHELKAFFTELSKRRNANYYDLAIFLLFTGLRIGEAIAITLEDIDFENKLVDVNKSLQYQDLRVGEFYFDDTKTENSVRKVLLPSIAMDALERVIARSKKLDEYARAKPFKNYRTSPSIFRTEYGAPITPHSFREVLRRVESDLLIHGEKRYGFRWVKHVTPHAFRHMHITYLQSGDVSLREVMGRVGHSNAETTMIYSHRTLSSQESAVKTLDEFAHSSELYAYKAHAFSSKHTKPLYEAIVNQMDKRKLLLTLNDIRSMLGLREDISPRDLHNILPRVRLDLSEQFKDFQLNIMKNDKSRVTGYEFSWN